MCCLPNMFLMFLESLQLEWTSKTIHNFRIATDIPGNKTHLISSCKTNAVITLKPLQFVALFFSRHPSFSALDLSC